MIRIAANLRQGVLAKDLDVTPNYLSLVENGKKEPSLTFLKNFSKRLDVSLGYLLWLALEEGNLPEEMAVKQKMDKLIVELMKKRKRDGGKENQISDVDPKGPVPPNPGR
jgi:transcriptional regulator with XRE-family HTH domain